LARRVVKEFETASKLAPEDLDIRFDLLDYYISAPGIVGGSKEKAEAQAKAIAKLNPKKGYVARAMIFEESKNPDLARKELLQATIDYPGDADAHKDLADFLLARKDFEGALVHAQRALALDRDSKRTKLLLAAARIRLRSNLEEACKALQELAAEQLRDEGPAFEEVYGWLGEFFLAKSDKIKAREAFNSALAFNPEYEPAKDGISRLRQSP
jgi:tetratricopeptide (TPR) repeat protein